METRLIYDPLKIILDRDREFEKSSIRKAAWNRRVTNPIPYIESIPYNHDYIIAQMVADPDLPFNDVKEIRRYMFVYWRAVKENMFNPEYRSVKLPHVGRFSLKKSKMRWLLQDVLIPYCREVEKRRGGKISENSLTKQRIKLAWRIYRAIDQRQLHFEHYVRFRRQKQKVRYNERFGKKEI